MADTTELWAGLRDSWIRSLRARGAQPKTITIYSQAADLLLGSLPPGLLPQQLTRAEVETFLEHFADGTAPPSRSGKPRSPAYVSQTYRALQVGGWAKSPGCASRTSTWTSRSATSSARAGDRGRCHSVRRPPRRSTGTCAPAVPTGTPAARDCGSASAARAPLSSSGVYQAVKRRGRAVGLPELHPHQFRHTSSHRWLLAGGSETDLMQLNGWKSRAMLSRYAASAAADRSREAHRRLGLGDELSQRRMPPEQRASTRSPAGDGQAQEAGAGARQPAMPDR